METYATQVKWTPLSVDEQAEIPSRRREWFNQFEHAIAQTGGKVTCQHFAPLGSYDAMFVLEAPPERVKELTVRLSLLPDVERIILAPATDPATYFNLADSVIKTTTTAGARR